MEDLQKIEKARLQKKTNTLNTKLRKERTHRLCVIGGIIEQQLGDTSDLNLYNSIQAYLADPKLKTSFDRWILNQTTEKNEVIEQQKNRKLKTK